MSEAHRYDAVHLRYEGNNIRYGEGCEVEVVTARAYDSLKSASVGLIGALNEARQVICSALRDSAPDWFDTDEKLAEHHTIKRIDAAIAKARSQS
ncbi:MAG: hypothetical protein ACK4HC_10960 [Cloacibacterium sp.]